MSMHIPEDASADPRIDSGALKGFRLFVEEGDSKVGRDVRLDGIVIGQVYAGEAHPDMHGPDAPKAWFRRDSSRGDRYHSAVLAAMAMASDLRLNRMPPGTSPVAEKWAAEQTLGYRFESFDAFLAWAEENDWPYKKPGVKNPTVPNQRGFKP